MCPSSRPLVAVMSVLALAGAFSAVAAAATLTGTVRNEAGAGLANVDLDFINLCTGDNLFLVGDKTAADGTFSVVVPTGRYDVHFTPPAGSVVAAGDQQELSVALSVSLGIVTLHPGTLVSGTVRTPSLSAAPGVDLKFVNQATDRRVYLTKDVTNVSGQYAVRVPPGTYDIDFRPTLASGLGDTERIGLVVGAIALSGLVNDLRTGFAISGSVRNASSSPQKNVDIDVFDECTGMRVPTAHDNTDASGNYTVIVPAGTYTFNYDPPECLGVEAARTPGLVVNGTRNIGTEQLKPAVPVSGVVVDHNGAPVASAKVKFYDATSVGAPRQAATGDRTDASGAFRILVPTGTYGINIEPPAGVLEQVGRLSGVDVSGPTSLGTIGLGAGLAVSGHLVNPANGPAVNVNINAVESSTRVAQRLAQDATDANGNFTVVVAPGTYDFQYDPPNCTGLAPMSRNSVVVNGPTALATLQLPTAVIVTGFVFDANTQPVASVDLDLYRTNTGEKIYTPNDKTAADGSYSLRIPPAVYRITWIPSSLSRLRPAQIASASLTTSQALPTQFLAIGWFVSGVVRDSATLAPIPDVAVDFYPPGSSTPAWTPHHLTGQIGEYEIAIDPGTWDILYTPPAGAGVAPRWRRGVSVAADTPMADVLLPPSRVGVPVGEPPLAFAAYPNPMRRQLELAFRAPDGNAELWASDLSGRRVATLWRGSGPATVVVRWDGRAEGGAALPAGVYYLRLATADGAGSMRRVVMVR